MIFELTARVVERKTTKVYETEGKLYQLDNFTIEVTNIFDEDVEFQIKTYDIVPNYNKEEDETEDDKKKKKKKKKIIKEEDPLVILQQQKNEDPLVPNAFFIKNNIIKLKKNQTKTITVQ